jgi:hypothetical protein
VYTNIGELVETVMHDDARSWAGADATTSSSSRST